MNELYMIYAGAVLKVGTLVGDDAMDTWDQMTDRDRKQRNRRFVLRNVSLEAARALYATQASGKGTRWAWGQENGTAAPTTKAETETHAEWLAMYGNLQFSTPTTRTFFTFAERVHDLAYRNTDTGMELVLHLTLNNWHRISEKA